MTAITSGCGGSYTAESTTPVTDASSDGTTADGTTTDAAAEANACGADLRIDPKNCGRCGHDCLGGACSSGKCDALHLGETGGRLSRVMRSGAYVLTSSVLRQSTETGGLWRVPVSGGVTELYVPLVHAEGFAVLGDLLYFAVDELPVDGADNHGGLYSCPLVGPAPCTPTLIASADRPVDVTADQGRVFYTDRANGDALMVYTAPGPPTVFRAAGAAPFSVATNVHVEGAAAFLTAVGYVGLKQAARLWEVLPDGGAIELYSYTSPSASTGRLFATPDMFVFSAFDFTATTGGVVRRIPRKGGGLCDLGGTTNVRPYGVHADASRVYWTNQGVGSALPYNNGSVVSCVQAGCCTTPEVLWKGPVQPTGLTGDDEALYFVTYAGSIWKVAKP